MGLRRGIFQWPTHQLYGGFLAGPLLIHIQWIAPDGFFKDGNAGGMHYAADPAPLRLAGPQPDGRHSSEELSAAMKQGRMLRIRRGIYISTAIWQSIQPSQRYQLSIAATSLLHPGALFCRESALSIHGLPLLSLPQKVHLRVGHKSSARPSRQCPMTGSLTPEDFLRRAKESEAISADSTTSRLLQGFDIARHMGTALDPDPETARLPLPHPGQSDDKLHHLPLRVEPLGACLVDTLPRLPFADATVALEAVMSRFRKPAPLASPELLELVEDGIKSQRKRRYLTQLLQFASSLSESPGESLTRVRLHELGIVQPDQQVELEADGKRFRVDFLWEKAKVILEFDGWMKYRNHASSFDQTHKQEKLREDALRSLGYSVLRVYWEDLMEPGCTRLRKLLHRHRIPSANPDAHTR